MDSGGRADSASGEAGRADGAAADGGTANDGAVGDAKSDGADSPSCSSDAGFTATDGGLLLDCASKPSACCYPDDTNTGVPAGTSLTAAGSMEIQTAGTTVTGLDVSGTIDVYANDVTIANTRVTVSSSGSYAVAIRPGVTGTILRDTTIQGQDNGANSVEYAVDNIGGNAVVLQRVDLFNCSECVIGSNIQLSDSYIHDAADPPGAHVEDIYGLAGSVYRHNTMANSYGQTAVVYLDPSLGGTTDCSCTVTDNLLIGGGGYTIYGGSSSAATATNVVITNNRISRAYFATGGMYGVDAYFDAAGAGNVWSGNVWDDTGATIAP